MEGSKELALTICEKIQNEYPKRPIWQTMLEIEDLINKHVEKQLLNETTSLPTKKRECTCSGMSDKVKCNFMCYD
jgi:hypothetical protein